MSLISHNTFLIHLRESTDQLCQSPLYSVCLLLTFNKSIQSIISLRIWFDKYCFIYFFEFAWSFQNFLLWHNIVAIGGWRHEIFSDILYPCIVACVVQLQTVQTTSSVWNKTGTSIKFCSGLRQLCLLTLCICTNLSSLWLLFSFSFVSLIELQLVKN